MDIMDIMVKILIVDIMDIIDTMAIMDTCIMDMETCIILAGDTDFTDIKGLHERTGLRGLH